MFNILPTCIEFSFVAVFTIALTISVYLAVRRVSIKRIAIENLKFYKLAAHFFKIHMSIYISTNVPRIFVRKIVNTIIQWKFSTHSPLVSTSMCFKSFDLSNYNFSKKSFIFVSKI